MFFLFWFDCDAIEIDLCTRNTEIWMQTEHILIHTQSCHLLFSSTNIDVHSYQFHLNYLMENNVIGDVWFNRMLLFFLFISFNTFFFYLFLCFIRHDANVWRFQFFNDITLAISEIPQCIENTRNLKRNNNNNNKYIVAGIIHL